MNKTMNILCACDKNFLPPTYVFMCSVMENHKDVKVNFYLLAAEDILDEDKEALKAYIMSEGHYIEFLNVDSSQFDGYVVHEKFPRSAYYRLMAHKYLPEDMDRILYLDVDIVVDKNIYEDFYSVDFDGNYLIATSHNPNPDYCNMLTPEIVNLESAARGEYFNSGVLIMNLDLFRKNITLDDYNRAYASCEKANLEIFYDQGLLNYMFSDKTKYFSSMDFNYRYSIPIQNKKRLEPGRVYKKSVLHYTGMCQPYKPWDLMLDEKDINKFGKVPFSNKYFYVSHELNELLERWWYYAEKTPIYEEILNNMRIKQKWFKRNLLDFTLMHNKMVSALESNNKNVITKTFYKDKEIMPKNFHWGAYKLGCFLASPYLFLKRILKKKK